MVALIRMQGSRQFIEEAMAMPHSIASCITPAIPQ